MQIGLAWAQALATFRFGANAEVHVGIGLVVVQHHDVLVVAQLGLGELTRRAKDAEGVGAPRHRQDDVERLATMADVVDQGSAVAPVLREFPHRVSPARDLALLVLDVEAAVLADVAEVGSNRLHATTTPSHLDHDLGRAANNRRLDP